MIHEPQCPARMEALVAEIRCFRRREQDAAEAQVGTSRVRRDPSLAPSHHVLNAASQATKIF